MNSRKLTFIAIPFGKASASMDSFNTLTSGIVVTRVI